MDPLVDGAWTMPGGPRQEPIQELPVESKRVVLAGEVLAIARPALRQIEMMHEALGRGAVLHRQARQPELIRGSVSEQRRPVIGPEGDEADPVPGALARAHAVRKLQR